MTSLSETTAIHSSLGKFLDKLLGYKKVLAQILGHAKAENEFMSWMELTRLNSTARFDRVDSKSRNQGLHENENSYYHNNELQGRRPIDSSKRTIEEAYRKLLDSVPELNGKCPELAKCLMLNECLPQYGFTRLIAEEMKEPHHDDPPSFLISWETMPTKFLTGTVKRSDRSTITTMVDWSCGGNVNIFSHDLRKYAKHKNRLTPKVDAL